MNKTLIQQGGASLGIELGSTRIKAVLIDDNFNVIASAGHNWENSLIDGIWTYSLEEVWEGVRDSYKKLYDKIFAQYNVKITKLKAVGFSAMMHGYLAFDSCDNQIAQFRTWRNTNTGEASEFLTKELNFNIPHRWSIAHLHQAVLNGENVNDLSFMTTLAGYIHWKLTGEKVIGVGDASGMFPIDSETVDYDKNMIEKYQSLIDGKYSWKLENILPKVLKAGDFAGKLTAEGALLLDPTGNLESGIPLCPPEGDAGTGMVATNSVAKKTGNVSAGTSIFLMVVLEKALSKVYPEIDMVTTPSGAPVAMVHCNNCSSDIDAWAEVFHQFTKAMGVPCDIYKVLDTLFYEALKAEVDCGGLVSFNYFSGEPITKMEEGRPLFVRSEYANFTFANFARNLLCSAVATLKLGMDILAKENVEIEKLLGHGGFFTAKEVGQRVMSSALKIPVSVMETAGEGGAWGIAVLAKYCAENEMDFADYLNEKVFAENKSTSVLATQEEIDGFTTFINNYVKALPVEKQAISSI